MALAYNSVTNTYSAGAVTSFGAIINSNVNAVYVAILFGNSASSDFTSIVQTNVNWSFQCWVQNINGAGRSAEVWVGIPTGTPGTSATINNNASCQMGIVCYSFTGVPTPLRADLLETVNISQHAGNQVVWQNIGTSPNNVAYLQACFIISPSGTAITTGATSYINYGSQPFGCGAAYTLYTSGTYVSGGIWSENSSYQMINVQVVLKGYLAVMTPIISVAAGPAYSTNNIVAAATPPWNFTPSNGQMWSQLSQVILGIQYWSSALTDSANPTSTGMSFTRLANCTAIQVTAGHYIHLEIWVGYSSIGACPLPVGGSPTLTLTPASGLSQTYVNVVVINMSGMDVVSKILENATFYHVENNASGNTYTVPGVVNNVTGDLGVMFVSQSANSASYYNYYYPNPVPTTPYSNGPCILGCFGLTTSAGTNSAYVTNGSGTISAWWEALVVILKAPGANVNSKNFVESISMSDTIQKTMARTYATETGIQAVIADTIVKNRKPGGPRTYTESIITLSDSIVKTPNKVLPKEVFTIADTFTKNRIPGGPQTFSEVITLADLGFNWHGSFHPTFTDAFTLADGGITPVLKHVANLTDTFTLAELFDSVHKQFTSFADALTLSDISSLTHDQELEFLEVFSLSDSISETYAQFLEVAEAFTLSDVFAEFHKAQITFTDVITLLESLVNVYTPGGGGGPIPVLATGALTGSSAAAAVVAALIFATALGSGRVTGLAGVAYQVAALLRGLCLLNALAGEHIVETGAATGGSAASGIEGAQIVVVGGSTEGDGDAESAAGVWTVPTGEADGVSPEMDCDTQCIFIAEGNTMPDTPGSAVGVAIYALLHLMATLRGASLAFAQVYSPIVASGGCGGGGTAEYVSIALYDAETFGGESEAVGVAGCLFHASGECDPIMASNASGNANYGPGQITGFLGGRGVVAGVPTVLVV